MHPKQELVVDFNKEFKKQERIIEFGVRGAPPSLREEAAVKLVRVEEAFKDIIPSIGRAVVKKAGEIQRAPWDIYIQSPISQHKIGMFQPRAVISEKAGPEFQKERVRLFKELEEASMIKTPEGLKKEIAKTISDEGGTNLGSLALGIDIPGKGDIDFTHPDVKKLPQIYKKIERVIDNWMKLHPEDKTILIKEPLTKTDMDNINIRLKEASALYAKGARGMEIVPVQTFYSKPTEPYGKYKDLEIETRR
jgi:hypothetical protein